MPHYPEKSIVPEVKGWEEKLTLVIRNAAEKTTIGKTKKNGAVTQKASAIHRTPEQVIADFWIRVDVRSDDECWIWKGGKHSKKWKYGRFCVGGNNIRANQFAASFRFGDVPRGLFACHHCDNPSCCNPRHLFVGTYQSNSDDMVEKGRKVSKRGAQRSDSKLTWTQVERIKREAPFRTYGWGMGLAREFGVSPQLINGIVMGRNRTQREAII